MDGCELQTGWLTVALVLGLFAGTTVGFLAAALFHSGPRD